MPGQTKNNLITILTVIIFIILFGWWLSLQILLEPGSPEFDYFSDTYGLIAGIGWIIGLKIANKWGGMKSFMGKAITYFSWGLFAQFFGQAVYSIYFYFLHIEAPYPSLGDLGFAGSIPLYIMGIRNLGKAAGVDISLRQTAGKAQAILFPLAMLILSYIVFLRNYEIDLSQPITTFLDFAYPFGQAIYVSMALLIYFLARNLLGGIMKNRILFILFAFVIQYIADFMFLYQTSRETWTAGGLNEVIYLTSYFLMILALISLDTVFEKIKNSKIG